MFLLIQSCWRWKANENTKQDSKENVAELLNLIKENPDLPIVPMVDSEIVASDEHTNWLGSFGKAEIDYVWDNGERIYFKSNDEEDLLERI